MAGYSVKNFDDIEPRGSDDGSVDGRFARKFLDSRQLGVSRFRYAAGTKAPYGHRHGEQEEAYVIIGGGGRMKLDDEVIDVRQWDVIRVAPETTRAFAAGPDGLEIIVVGGNRPESGDGELVNDFWP